MSRPGPAGVRRRRANAAADRAELLAVAEDLVVQRGVGALTMNAVAAAAGVGVGTVYRRFGDQGGLVEALMDRRERCLQQAIAEGEPPLGPGAPPDERIRAFLHAYIDVLDAYAPLMAAAEATMTPERRYRTGPYAVHHAHLASLVHGLAPEADADYLADSLLAPLAAGLFTLQRHTEHATLTRLKTGIDTLVLGVASTPSPGYVPGSCATP